MKTIRFYLLFHFFVISQLIFSQSLQIDSTCQNISSSGDDLFPKWSADGSQLLYQSKHNGIWDIYVYNFFADTVFQLTEGNTNEQHPEWVPDKLEIVFDSDREGVKYLYKKDLITGIESKLFKRSIPSKQASFPPTNRLVYFSGYDRLTEDWAIYSYDFVSDNLNDLTDLKGNCVSPIVSPKGKQLLFQQSISTFPFEGLFLLNWYGNQEAKIDALHAMDATWGPNGLKIYFVSTRDQLQGEIYSIWKDGTHMERLTNDDLKVRTPAVSPDGSKIAVSVLSEGQYDIFIILLEQY